MSLLLTKELEFEKTRKSQKKILRLRENSRFFHILKRIVFLRVELSTNLMKVLELSVFMNRLLILMFWLRYFFKKATYIRNKTGGSFSPIPRKLMLLLVSITSSLQTNCQAYQCFGIAIILWVTLAFRISLREQHTR